MRRNRKFKKGAASFYIVAFSTLILMILATSFAAVIISEITRTSNDDLSQSAYDSAMAGVEDAKLAFYSYRNCVAQGDAMNAECRGIVDKMNEQDCDMVSDILGRTTVEGGGVIIQETNVSNNMQQAYTCVEIDDSLEEYASSLSTSNIIDVIEPKFDDGVTAAQIGEIQVNWYEDQGKVKTYADYSNPITFQSDSDKIPNPPVLFVAVLQTAENFKMSDFETSIGDTTDRGMVYLVPAESISQAVADNAQSVGAYKESGKNIVGADGLVRSNSKTAMTGDKATNRPYSVFCDPNGSAQYLCSATIQLPEPVGGARSDETFTVVVGLPYGKGETDFTVEFRCKDGSPCGNHVPDETGAISNEVNLKGVQVQIDSTGKANDLFRRVQVRLKNEDHSVLSIMGPLELLGTDGNPALKKDYRVGCEGNFTDEDRGNCPD